MTTALYRFDFTTDPLAAGWTYSPSEAGGKLVFIPSEGYYPDKGGKLTSPVIPCTDNPWQFYRIRFETRAMTRSYWCVFFRDRGGHWESIADIYASVQPSTDWQANTVCIRGRENATAFTVNFQSTEKIEVRHLVVEPIDRDTVVAWADALYATLPPLSWTQPADRFARLPRFMERLRRGGPVRIVMLGDSIINDTNNSLWDALLMRHYPKAEVHIQPSVLGSTGCWKYREPAYFQAYVAEWKPHLLMIGGISHREDADAVREVIRLARALPDCETMLMSGPVGRDERAHTEGDLTTPLPVSPAADHPFNAALHAVAEAGQITYLDMNTIWHTYIGASQKPFEWFHRDLLHANDRGKQILGRILERFFAP